MQKITWNTHIALEAKKVMPVRSYPSLDLQQRTGDIQRFAAAGPVLLTGHGKPRSVIMSVAEFVRLKQAAGEPVPPEAVQGQTRTVRAQDDPLGYGSGDYDAMVARMLDDVRSGRTKAAVREELARVRAAWGRMSR